MVDAAAKTSPGPRRLRPRRRGPTPRKAAASAADGPSGLPQITLSADGAAAPVGPRGSERILRALAAPSHVALRRRLSPAIRRKPAAANRREIPLSPTGTPVFLVPRAPIRRRPLTVARSDLGEPWTTGTAPRPLRALAHRNYRLFFGGQSLSLVGTWITRVAVSWLTWRLTHSAAMLGVVGFAGQIPTFLLGPFAGVWVDRLDRYKVLVTTQVLAMLQSFALAALAIPGVIHIWAHPGAAGLPGRSSTPSTCRPGSPSSST